MNLKKILQNKGCLFKNDAQQKSLRITKGQKRLPSHSCPQNVLFFCPFRPEKEPQFKFIYFNHMNLAEKSTIHMRKTASVCLTSVHPDLMKILGDINCDFARYGRER